MIRRRLIGAAAVILLAVLCGCSSGPIASIEGSKTVTAHFDNANGMYVGNAVSVLGFKIGSIDTIEPEGATVRITMSVDGSIDLPDDVQAVAVTDSILTDRHIELTPAYTGGATLPDGAELDLDRTRTPVEFDSVLAMMDKLSTSLAGDGQGNGPVGALIDVSSQATDGNGESIRTALGQLSQALKLSDDPSATRDSITAIIRNLESLSSAAAANDQSIRDFGSGVRQMSDLLADLDLGSGDTGTKLNQILSSVVEIADQYRPELATTVSNTNVITKTLSDYNGDIGEFLDVFPLTVNNAGKAIDSDAGAVRVHVNPDKVILDSQLLKEVCNLLNLKQLGCATGTMADMGPDFGVTAMLAGMAGLGQ